jgi:outer membrane protein
MITLMRSRRSSTATQGIFAASQAYDAVKGRYDIGAANFVELSNAQAVLLQAKVNKAQADIKLSLQKNVIDYYLGK